jgi:hypothetical protein
MRMRIVPIVFLLWLVSAAAAALAAPAIQITEIFPRATSGIPEWFEINNTSLNPIDLRNWKFGAVSDTGIICTTSVRLDPGDFLVVTRDTLQFKNYSPAIKQVVQALHWHTLDNYNDTLMLLDSSNALVDMAIYHSSSFTNWTNQSLERLDTAAVSTAGGVWILADQPSPGQPNPAVAWHAAGQPGIEIGPIPFSPNNDGKDDFLAINVQLPMDATLELSIYGFSGVRYCSFAGAPRKQYLWDGRCDNNTNAPVGPFFVIARIKSSSGTQIIRKGGVLWR